MSDSLSPRLLLAAAFAGSDAAITDYLLTGTDVALPATMSESVRAAVATIEPKTRAEFYLAMDRLDRADDMVLVRLGRLLAAAPQRGHSTPDGVPASIWAVLSDATYAVFGMHGTAPAFTTMTIDRIGALLALEGVMPGGIDGMIVDLLIGASHSTLEYGPRGLQTIPGTAIWAAEHAPVVAERAHRFSSRAHLELARLAWSHPPLAVAVAPTLVSRALEGSADERVAALAAMGAIPVPQRLTTLEAVLEGASARDRARLIPAIERLPDIAAGIALVERERARASAAARGDFDRAIRRMRIFERLAPEGEVPPLVPLAENPLGPEAVESMRRAVTDLRDRLRERLPALRAERDEFVRANPNQYPGNAVEWTEDKVRAIAELLDQLPAVVAYLSGTAAHPGRRLLDPLLDQRVSGRLVGFAPVNRLRLSAHPGRHPSWAGIAGAADVPDARAIADVLVRAGCTPEEAHGAVIRSALVDAWSSPGLRPDQLTWYLREHPRIFDNVLGLSVGNVAVGYYNNRSDVLKILAASETLPPKYVAVVTGLAIGPGKTHRPAAQAVLARHGLAEALAEDTLLSPAADQRAVAIAWVQDIGGSWATATLARHLDAEEDPGLRARTIAALEALGDDITQHLRPEVLAAEASAGLRRKLPAALAWIPLDDLPACIYRDGTRVPGDVVRWWAILAATLKDPLGAGLLPRHLRTLEPVSAQTLGRWVLMTWIARDTTPLDDATVMARAMQAVARYEKRMQQAFLLYPEIEASVVDLFDRLDEERARVASAATSAIADKGLLALAGMIPGHELAETVRQYMRREHLKRAQIEALMHVLSTSDDAEPVQLLVATARRYRTASVQQTAADLVDQVAERRGWTSDELADRMIPTAGLDADRALHLDFGSRTFTARLTNQLTLRLETAEGEVIKALPAPRAADTSAGAAKAAFAASRKELKEIVRVQRRRLCDAMCLRRQWPVAQWRELLAEHPIMGLLVSALVWQVDGMSVRPGQDGIVRDVAGSPVALSDDATITLAHTTTLPADEIARWSPADVAAFDQFRAAPVEPTDATSRSDREGRAGETFRLRSRASALEWDRGPTGDDVRFDEYVKTFPSARLQAVVTFSGSQLPETNQPIEFGVLTVRRLDANGRATADLTFADVPDALRAELVADYLALGE